MEKLKVFTAFSGYDSQCMALDRIGIDYDLVGWSEIDRFAIQAHNALFPEYAERNFGDISKIDWTIVPDFDLFTYSSPCQDFSIAGLQRGGVEGSGTRSSLLWECKRAIIAKRPKYLLMENVKALVSDKFRTQFLEWQLWLQMQGYSNHSQVLNAKDYGVPQNRERIFCISILCNGGGYSDSYYFPKKVPLQLRLRDMLEVEVDMRYYLSETMIKGFKAHTDRTQSNGNGFRFEPTFADGVAKTITTAAGNRPTDNFIYDTVRQVGVLKETAWHENNVVATPLAIRKLTPKECFRLMGVTDSDIDTIQSAGISNSQQYKLAGNSIVVDVLVAIFRKLFIDKKNDNQQQTLF